MLGDQDGVRARLDLRVADAPGHHGLSAVLHAAFSQLAFRSLDRPAELPALADGNDFFRWNFALDHRVVNRADPDWVDSHLVQ
ncbi:hypothetical protein D3C86_1800470 [compost metagenome]